MANWRLFGATHAPRSERRLSSLNDSDRADWLDNDEGLYSWWKGSRMSKRDFIRANRAEIDSAINRVRDGSKPAHFLAYGGR